MEPIGLGIGIIGLAGLFTTCLDAIDRAKAYRSFAADADVFDVQFSAQRLRLEQWGHDVGFDGKNVSTEHHPRLDQQQTRDSVADLFRLVNKILDPNSGPAPESIGRRSAPLRGGNISERCASKTSRLGWALGGKGAATDQLKLLRDLINLLYGLVPPTQQHEEGGTSAPPSPPSPEWLGELRQVIADQQAEKRRQIMAWILGQNYQNRWDSGFWNDRISGTCEWILTRQAFRQWAAAEGTDPTSQILWVHGSPGFGKTFLCSRIVQYLSEESGEPTAAYFMSSDYVTRDDPYTIIRSWISQLCSHTHVFELVSHCWQATSDQEATRLTIIDILRDILRGLPKCFLVVDGLDECSASEDGNCSISKFLTDVSSILGPSNRMLIVSRELSTIREALRFTDTAVSMSEYRVSPEDVQTDIARFSRHIVDRKLAKKSEDFRAELATAMASKCEGQFQWLKVQESSLTAWKSSKQLHIILENTPKKLEEVYERDWKKVLESDRNDRAINLLRWAAFAAHPLTVSEIAEAVCINEDCDDLLMEDMPGEYVEEYLHDEIVALCGPLIEVGNQQDDQAVADWTIHLSHFTVKQFLLSRLPVPDLGIEEALRFSNEQLQNTFLARQCLLYIEYPRIWQQEDDQAAQVLPHIAFRAYSASQWYVHLCRGVDLSRDSETDARVMSFLDEAHPTFRPWASGFDACSDYEREAAEKETVPPIPAYYALELRLEDVAIRLLRKSGLGERGRERIRHPLNEFCLLGGKTEALRAILDCGADVNAKDASGRSSLCVASMLGRTEIVKTLLDRKAHVDVADREGWRPIHYASVNGSLDVLRALVEHGADVSAANTTNQLTKPIHMAALNGHISVIQVLLENGASLDADNIGEATALHAAALGGHLEVIEYLLENGGSLDATDEHRRTALHRAAGRGHLDAVTYLREKGAKVNSINGHGNTPLHCAIMTGHLDVAKYLIQSGTDLDIANNDGDTPLHIAALYDHLDIAKYLVENGANLNAVNCEYGDTPLHLAMQRGRLDPAEYLIKKDADLGVTNCEGETPLYEAACLGQLEVVRFLVEAGGNMEAVDLDDHTPLWWAAFYGHLDVVKYLVSKGSRLESPGKPALHAAASGGHLDTLDLLMEMGASLNCGPNSGPDLNIVICMAGHHCMLPRNLTGLTWPDTWLRRVRAYSIPRGRTTGHPCMRRYSAGTYRCWILLLPSDLSMR